MDSKLARRTQHQCPSCGSVATRWRGPIGALLQPRWPDHCLACGAHLETGDVDAFLRLQGRVIIMALTLVSAMIGGSVAATAGILAWPELWNSAPVRIALIVVGGACGAAFAHFRLRRPS